MGRAALTVAGGAVGSLLGPAGTALGMALGGAVGGWVDANYIEPWLFPPEQNEPQKLDDLALGRSSEGSPIIRAYGRVRIPGTVIWIGSKEIVNQQAQNVGKGGGSSSSNVNNSYSGSAQQQIVKVNLAVAACLGEIEAIEKIWADGEVIYDSPATSPQVVSDKLETFYLVPYTYIRNTDGSVDLSVFKGTYPVTVSGFANAGNNGTFPLLASSSQALQIENQSVVTEAAGATVTITQAGLPAQIPGFADDITFYLGTTTQDPDPLIEADTLQPSGIVPGYRGISYVVFEKLSLSRWGNRIPSFLFQVRERTSLTSRTLLTDLTELYGHTPDVDRVYGTLDGINSAGGGSGGGLTSKSLGIASVPGYVIVGPQDARTSIAPVTTTYDVDPVEADGVIEYVSRGEEDEITIEAGDLGAADSRQSAPASVQDIPDYGMPSSVTVAAVDDAGQQQSAQVERHPAAVHENDQRLELKTVLTADEIRRIAKRELWKQWASRQSIEFSLPPEYLHILEGDILAVTLDDLDFKVKVQETNFGNNYRIHIKGAIILNETWDFEEDAPDAEGVDDDISDPAHPNNNAIAIVGAGGALRDMEQMTPGIHVGVSPTSSKPLGTVLIYSSVDEGVSYDELGPVTSEATIGITSDALGGPPAYFGLKDEVNSVNVGLWGGKTLESVTWEEVLDGKNWAQVGDEIIGFETVVLESDGTYTLSDLYRGRLGTEQVAGDHVTAEDFVLLDKNLTFFPVQAANLNKEALIIAVPPGGDPDDFTGITHTYELLTARPYAPIDVEATTDEADDITVSFVRRTCLSWDMIRNPRDHAPTMEPELQFRILVADTSGGDPHREIIVTGEIAGEGSSGTYTAAQQTADGYTPGVDTFYFTVQQYGHVIGYGVTSEEVSAP